MPDTVAQTVLREVLPPTAAQSVKDQRLGQNRVRSAALLPDPLPKLGGRGVLAVARLIVTGSDPLYRKRSNAASGESAEILYIKDVIGLSKFREFPPELSLRHCLAGCSVALLRLSLQLLLHLIDKMSL